MKQCYGCGTQLQSTVSFLDIIGPRTGKYSCYTCYISLSKDEGNRTMSERLWSKHVCPNDGVECNTEVLKLFKRVYTAPVHPDWVKDHLQLLASGKPHRVSYNRLEQLIE